MKRQRFCLALSLALLIACAQQDKVIIAMEGIIAAATVDSIIQSNNPLVVQLDSIIIDDAGKTIDLWTMNPHTSALIGQIAGIWTDLLKTVKPEIQPIVSAIVQAINRFIAQVQAVTPIAAPAPSATTKARTAPPVPPKLSAADNAKVTEMREKLQEAKAKLAGNPAYRK